MSSRNRRSVSCSSMVMARYARNEMSGSFIISSTKGGVIYDRNSYPQNKASVFIMSRGKDQMKTNPQVN